MALESRPRPRARGGAAVAATRRCPTASSCGWRRDGPFRFLRAAARSRAEEAVGHGVGATPGAHGSSSHVQRRPARVTAAAVVAGVVVLIGSRLLLSGHLPVVGGYLPIPGPGRLLSDYLGGSAGPGSGPVGPVSPAYAIVGLAGILAGGAMGVVLKRGDDPRHRPVGPSGRAPLIRPFGVPTARLAAGVVYLFLPLPWDDLARRRDLQGLAVYGLMPWILGRVARSTGLPPFSSEQAPAPLAAATVEEVRRPWGPSRPGRRLRSSRGARHGRGRPAGSHWSHRRLVAPPRQRGGRWRSPPAG